MSRRMPVWMNGSTRLMCDFVFLFMWIACVYGLLCMYVIYIDSCASCFWRWL